MENVNEIKEENETKIKNINDDDEEDFKQKLSFNIDSSIMLLNSGTIDFSRKKNIILFIFEIIINHLNLFNKNKYSS